MNGRNTIGKKTSKDGQWWTYTAVDSREASPWVLEYISVQKYWLDEQGIIYLGLLKVVSSLAESHYQKYFQQKSLLQWIEWGRTARMARIGDIFTYSFQKSTG